MDKNATFLVRVDKFGNWTEDKYQEVTREELDKHLEKYAGQLMDLIAGPTGAMAMWACFKNILGSGCYADAINAYRMLAGDHKSLVEREHELRHLWNKYDELRKIRYYGTVEAAYLKRAAEAKERRERILKKQEESACKA